MPTSNLIIDFGIQGCPAKNVCYNGNAYNMGGCMGCHGNAQAFGGGDFNLIITSVGSDIQRPEVPGPQQAPDLEKYLRLLPNR